VAEVTVGTKVGRLAMSVMNAKAASGETATRPVR
jgi:hypothetical protein